MHNYNGRVLLQLFLILVILAVGIGAFVALTLFKDKPVKIERSFHGPMVNVITVQKKDIPITVHGYGTVRAKTEIGSVPEVSGKIIAVHPHWADGEFFS